MLAALSGTCVSLSVLDRSAVNSIGLTGIGILLAKAKAKATTQLLVSSNPIASSNALPRRLRGFLHQVIRHTLPRAANVCHATMTRN